ncbi:MAG: DNA repair protein RadA, partial [Chloroflexota bacterium]|nr:DNA repair protein RadA [Chloroflexota bacterium]
ASDMVVCGEVGLSGEVRNIPSPQRRISEAFRLGLTKCLLPELSKNDVDPIGGMDFIFVRTLREAFDIALGQGAIK